MLGATAQEKIYIGDVVQEDMITNIIENLESNEEFDFNTLYEDLELLSRNPLSINESTYESLKELRLLNDIQINDLLQHIDTNGPLLSTLELQAIASFDLNTIKSILPFIKVSGSDNYQVGLGKMLREGKQDLFLKWRRTLEDQKGYLEDKYLGDPNRLFMRYRYNYESRLRIGFTGEKDAGESFFKDSNRAGFDFYSAHIHLKDYKSWLGDVIIGDYTISMGQGLILSNAFGSGKSAFVMNLRRGGRSLRSYNSINEALFFRGGAAEFKLGENYRLLAFASRKQIDGNLVERDTLEIESGIELFSSIIQSGFHRTASEIEDERSIQRTSAGGKLEYKSRNLKIGINTLYESFDQEFLRTPTLYNQFQFSGTALWNGSIDYGYRLNNINLFGEVAVSDNSGTAQLHGALFSLDRNLDVSLLYRDYSREYQSLNSNSFGETVGTNNESGLYIGAVLRFNNEWYLSAYADLWKHDWLRFRRDAPSNGKEFLFRLNHYKKRKYSFYAQYRFEQKALNANIESSPIDPLGITNSHRLRLNYEQTVTKALKLRNRVEFSWFDRDDENTRGYLLYQDIIFKPIAQDFSFTARYCLFDTESFDTRIYAYENDLTYEFFIPFFQNRGKRYYVNLRYDGIPNTTLEFRAARTILENQETIGSGNETIFGNKRTELKAQLRFRF